MGGILREADVEEILPVAVQPRREAFAMGQLERLGAGSWVRQLEGKVIRSVLEKV